MIKYLMVILMASTANAANVFQDGTGGVETISTSKLGNDSVTSVKIADGAVTTAKIGDGSITTSKFGPGILDELSGVVVLSSGAPVSGSPFGAINVSQELLFTNVNGTTVTLSLNGVILQNTDVGFPGTNLGFDIGEGGSYFKNKDGDTIVRVFTYDDDAGSGSKFTELTTRAGTMLAANDDALYIGSPFVFWAQRFKVTTAKSSEELACEYWTGSIWVAYDTMVTEKTLTTHRTDSLLENVETQYSWIQADIDISATPWVADDNDLDETPNTGSNLYWIRIRNTEAVGTPAVLEDIRVRGSDFDFVSGSPILVRWGKARGVFTEIKDPKLDFLKPTLKPGNVDTAISETIVLKTQENGFADSVIDELSLTTLIPSNADTSSKMDIQILWFSAATSGDVQWKSTTSITNNSSVLGIASASNPEMSASAITTVSGTAHKINITTISIDITEAIPGESVVNVLLGRDATANNSDDTMAGTAVLWTTRLKFRTWK